MLQPICANCKVAMRCAKNDFIVRDPCVDGFSSTYWAGDLFECPECGCQVVVGFGRQVDAKRAENIGWKELAMEFCYGIKPTAKE